MSADCRRHFFMLGLYIQYVAFSTTFLLKILFKGLTKRPELISLSTHEREMFVFFMRQVRNARNRGHKIKRDKINAYN